jgi:hypothetical protein
LSSSAALLVGHQLVVRLALLDHRRTLTVKLGLGVVASSLLLCDPGSLLGCLGAFGACIGRLVLLFHGAFAASFELSLARSRPHSRASSRQDHGGNYQHHDDNDDRDDQSS